MVDMEPGTMSTVDLNADAERGPRSTTGEGSSTEFESAQAKQAKAEALEHARAARSAAAKYARLAGKSGEHDPGLPAVMQTVMEGDAPSAMEMQDRIGRSERAIAWGIAVNDLRRTLPQALKRPGELQPGEAIAGGIASWWPVLFLNPGQRKGFKGKASDPRWQSLALIIAGGGLTEGIRAFAAAVTKKQAQAGGPQAQAGGHQAPAGSPEPPAGSPEPPAGSPEPSAGGPEPQGGGTTGTDSLMRPARVRASKTKSTESDESAEPEASLP